MNRALICLLVLFYVSGLASAFEDNSNLEYHYYVYGANGLVAKIQGEEISYYHKDHLGSNSLVTDSSGKVISKVEYYPFGESFREEGEERYKYTGKEEDSSGLYYYGARYYDASLGRFISVDPIKSYDSPYVYVSNNPMKYVDPSGMFEVYGGYSLNVDLDNLYPDREEYFNTFSRFKQGRGFNLGFSKGGWNFGYSHLGWRDTVQEVILDEEFLGEKLLTLEGDWDIVSHSGSAEYSYDLGNYFVGSCSGGICITKNNIEVTPKLFSFGLPISLAGRETIVGGNIGGSLRLKPLINPKFGSFEIGPFLEYNLGYSDVAYDILTPFGNIKDISGDLIKPFYSKTPASQSFENVKYGGMLIYNTPSWNNLYLEIKGGYDFENNMFNLRSTIHTKN